MGRSKKTFLPYNKARELMIKNGVISSGSFALVNGEMVSGKCCYRTAYKDIHPSLPSSPESAYAGKGWRGWKHFLGKKVV